MEKEKVVALRKAEQMLPPGRVERHRQLLWSVERTLHLNLNRKCAIVFLGSAECATLGRTPWR